MKIQDKIFSLTQKIDSLVFVRAIRSGLVMIMPILMIGAFALIGKTFPIKPYLTFINTFMDGFIFKLFDMVYYGTFGMLSVFMTFAISVAYCREQSSVKNLGFGAQLTALTCFFILSGTFETDFKIEAIGPKGMITALISGFLVSFLYLRLSKRLKRNKRAYVDGADTRFNAAISVIMPATIVVAFFSFINVIIVRTFDVSSFYKLVNHLVNFAFLGLGRTFFSGFLYVLSSSLLWFFGIHGSDCLEGVTDNLFLPAIQENIQAVNMGAVPAEILTKQFIDVFVLIGGCGSALCLLLALFIFGKRKNDRRLSKMAAFPMIFNINEIMIFGLPIILNPIMFIPFILTPICCYILSYSAMRLGIVGLTISKVEWTTPIILGGYVATGGVGGSILQIVNLSAGTLIYAPFVKMLDRQKQLMATTQYNKLVDILKEHEISRREIILTEMEQTSSEIAKSLFLELEDAIDNNKLEIYYQPQYNYAGDCFGVEALLRWRHPTFGMIYPPLVIKLADEAKLLCKLEKHIINKVLIDRPVLMQKISDNVKISVNITGNSLVKEWFLPFMKEVITPDMKNICLEITEQTALRFDDALNNVFRELKAIGLSLAIDDFSMGQTSIDYLVEKQFDIVKLDGKLIMGIIDNPRCTTIVSSIVKLSGKLDIQVLAEYVETNEQREALHKIKCDQYQGYLYSPAVKLADL